MTVNKFAERVTKAEGLRKSITIAQVLEVLKIVNTFTGGALYAWIKAYDEGLKRINAGIAKKQR